MNTTCPNKIQRSLDWCEGTPEYAGIKRRIFYIAKSFIAKWPTLAKDTDGRITAAKYVGSFVLAADASWKHIDVLSDKCQVTSEAQGEGNSQTQLNKLVAVHPSVGEEASSAALFINNSDNVFLVEDMNGRFRVIGSDRWMTKSTVTQDMGQGAAGSASTTINAEASDVAPAPFYDGQIVTENGTINEDEEEENPGDNNPGGNNPDGDED